ncbi:amidase [Marinobacter caseinilyticus]|uniref:amidase n=1 Tax=Marinobacter caseinilyticus TaxID=2692195 RepID=UPI0014096FFF|nr:amidase [Marinobacter caseinilyticus]
MTAQQTPKSLHAFSDDALADHDATALAEQLRRGELSIDEVTAAAIARAEAMEPLIHAIATSDFASARQQKPPLPDRCFAGVPTFIKDNTDITGLPTGHGSGAIHGRPARTSCKFMQQFMAQGFVCLGKSKLPEFGFNATTEYEHDQPTRNPWNPDYSAGASSGGAAALVAAGVVPMAHANDGGGSIRIPAACCGLIGLKPSRGRLVDGHAAKSLPINVIVEGVLTRSVRDTANFFAAAEHHYQTKRLPAIGSVTAPAARCMKIGVILDSVNGHKTDAETRVSVENTALRLADLGHHLEAMPMPVADSFPDDFALYWSMLAFAVRTTGNRTMDTSFSKHQVDGLTLGLDRRFKRRVVHLPAALWRLRRSYHDYAHAMAGYDAVLMPVLGHTTPEIGFLCPTVDFDTLFDRLTHYACFTPLANATGAPAISLPMGTSRNNLPIGVQLMANHGRERTLLELAFELEQAAPWRKITA